MPELYDELLDATIQHLEDRQARGEKFVAVTSEVLAMLDSAAPSSNVTAAATPSFKSSPPPMRLDAESRSVSSRPNVEPISPTPALTPEEKTNALAEFRQQVLVCEKCPHLVKTRKSVVFGVGTANAKLMFVGEAPGADEDAQGEPFVGAAGQLLTRIIVAMGLTRETVYIANVLKCRPDTPGQSHGNRKPTPDEMKTCIPHLNRQVEIIRPSVVVALGATAVEGLLGLEAAGITRLRGNWREFRGVPVMPTFHPSFLLRPENASKKRLVWEDMLQVMERLGLPISEKQHSFFLKPA